MGEETQGHGTMDGTEEAACHLSHPPMFLSPKGPVGRFCLYLLVFKVVYAVAKGWGYISKSRAAKKHPAF